MFYLGWVYIHGLNKTRNFTESSDFIAPFKYNLLTDVLFSVLFHPVYNANHSCAEVARHRAASDQSTGESSESISA